MYINLEVFKKSGLQPNDILFLCAIKQTETEFLIENLTEDDYKRFKELSLVTHIKTGSKKDHPYKSLRLSQKCKTLMSELEIPNVGEEHIRMRDYLISIYLSNEDKERVVGNKKLINTNS